MNEGAGSKNERRTIEEGGLKEGETEAKDEDISWVFKE
jgi:hypothetical protein